MFCSHHSTCSANGTSRFERQAFKSCSTPIFYPSTPALFQLATQNSSLNEFFLVACRTGNFPSSHTPHFKARVEHIAWSNDRILATMYNTPQPKSKLTRTDFKRHLKRRRAFSKNDLRHDGYFHTAIWTGFGSIFWNHDDW